MNDQTTTDSTDHKKRHAELHAALDELVADWIANTESLPSKHSVLSLMKWSYMQTTNPSGKP